MHKSPEMPRFDCLILIGHINHFKKQFE